MSGLLKSEVFTNSLGNLNEPSSESTIPNRVPLPNPSPNQRLTRTARPRGGKRRSKKQKKQRRHTRRQKY